MNPNTKTIYIESSHNKMFKEFLLIKNGERKKEGLLLIEGKDLIDEAKNAHKLLYVLTSKEEEKVEGYINYLLPQSLIARLSSFKTPSTILGIAKLKFDSEPGERAIYLDRVQDPGNVGTIIRTALSLGYSSVLLSSDCASLSNSKTIQSSKGSIFRINVGYASLDSLIEKHYHLYLTTLDGKDIQGVDHLVEPFVLVFGNEGQGIPKAHQKGGEKLKIEMNSFDSLNVAVAAGIFMYKFKD